jgi:hypothetical protein
MPRSLAALLFAAVPLAQAFRATPVCASWSSGASTARSLVTLQADEDTSGKGFAKSPTSQDLAEARGRVALDALRAKNGQVAPEAEAIPELSGEIEGGSPVLGLAGFLIFIGIVSVFVGGPLWEDAKEGDSAATASNEPAFGFIPSSEALSSPQGPSSPSWASGS